MRARSINKHIQWLCCRKGLLRLLVETEHRVLSCTQTRWKDRRKHDDKVSEALSGRYFFDRVLVGTGATKRELRNVEANHSGPLRVLRDERWEAFQQWHYRYE